jgi:hypothetical protein
MAPVLKLFHGAHDTDDRKRGGKTGAEQISQGCQYQVDCYSCLRLLQSVPCLGVVMWHSLLPHNAEPFKVTASPAIYSEVFSRFDQKCCMFEISLVL